MVNKTFANVEKAVTAAVISLCVYKHFLSINKGFNETEKYLYLFKSVYNVFGHFSLFIGKTKIEMKKSLDENHM